MLMESQKCDYLYCTYKFILTDLITSEVWLWFDFYLIITPYYLKNLTFDFLILISQNFDLLFVSVWLFVFNCIMLQNQLILWIFLTNYCSHTHSLWCVLVIRFDICLSCLSCLFKVWKKPYLVKCELFIIAIRCKNSCSWRMLRHSGIVRRVPFC